MALWIDFKLDKPVSLKVATSEVMAGIRVVP